jgi:hypothetical protein
MYTIARLWRGEIGLGRTFWFWYTLIGGILIGNALTIPGQILYAETGSPALFVVGWGMATAMVMFFMVAVWRSAGNYTGRRIWFYVTRGLVISYLISFPWSLYLITNGKISVFWVEMFRQAMNLRR